MFGGNSIRRQLVLPLLTTAFAVIAGISAGSAWIQSSRARATLERRQDDAVLVLEQAAWPLTAAVVRQIAGLTGQEIVVWESGSPRPPVSSLTPVPPNLLLALREAAANLAAPNTPLQIRNGSQIFRVRLVRPRWQPQAVAAVLLSQQMLDEARWNAAWPPAAIGSTAMLAVLPWLITLTGRWSRRLQHIQQQVAAIARSETPAPPATQSVPHRGDELAAVLEDVQALAERLRELQEQLLRTEREQLVAQLVTGFAHQFRNGLSGVSLALQVHQTRCRAPADRSLEILHRQLQLLETEVRGLLSLDKRAASVFTRLDLAQLLRESISLVEPALEHHSVQLHVVAPPSLVIPGIRDSLRAACVNLLQNAAEAAGPGGEIQVLLQQHPQHALIQISDNGQGPPPEIAPRMKEAFVTTKAEGLGLGLAIVNAAAQVHKGTLSWKREQNWTTMELTLPVNQESGDPA